MSNIKVLSIEEVNVTFSPKAKLPYKQRIIVKIKIILYLSVEAK